MDSNLQIISGRWRGKKLHLPPNARPTQNKARLALFNMLNGTLPAVVWDAFAGSGAFGLEWLSRAPNAKIIFTDTDAASIKTIRKNLAMLDTANATISQQDAISGIENFGAHADLIFIDPPYAGAKLGAEFIKKIAQIAKPGAVLVWEIEKDFILEQLPEKLKIVKDKTYGRARFLILSAQ